MKSNATWIVVADEKLARFYNSWNKVNDPIEAVPFEMRLLNDLALSNETDKRGRSAECAGRVGHAMAQTDIHRDKKRRFANRIADFLREQSLAGRFGQVILIAPLATLGDLRISLDNETRSLVAGEIAKDFTHLEAEKIHEHLLEKEWFYRR